MATARPAENGTVIDESCRSQARHCRTCSRSHDRRRRGIYDRHQYLEEKAHALKALAGLVEIIVSPPVGNVVSLEARAL